MTSTVSYREQVETLLIRLAKAKQLCRIYGISHSVTHNTTNPLYKLILEILKKKNEITIGIIREEFVYDKAPFYKTSKTLKDFIDHLKLLGIRKITFFQGLTQKEFNVFIQIISIKPQTPNPSEEIESILEAENVKNIAISGINIDDHNLLNEIPDIDAFTRSNFDSSLKFLKETYTNLKENQPINFHSLRKITAGLVNSLLINKNLLLMLASVKLQDEDEFIHNVNVCIFTLLQTELLGLESKYLFDVAAAALLHNIGKIWYDEETIDETANTDLGEYPIHAMQNIQGAKLLLKTKDISPLPSIVAFEQDINYDFSGYPEKLVGTDLNMISMMIAIAKYYDKARRSELYYKMGGPEKLYEDMQDRLGQRFHPDLLKNFFGVLGVYPPGTLVELDNQEVALVIQSSFMDIKRPQVEILYKPQGEKYQDPLIVSLLEKNNRGEYKWNIVKSISPYEKFAIPEKYKS